MFPAAFDYAAPDSLEEAVSLLQEKGEGARVLAGGQSLIPMMKLRLAAPSFLVDINRIDGLDTIERHNGSLRIGALVRHNRVIGDPDITATSPLMASAAPWVADPIVRNRGTVCGSVAHCDPEGDWNSVMLAARASVIATGASGDRVIDIDDFVVDFFTNSLQPGEIVTAVSIPVPQHPSGGSYQKLERRVGDYATVAVAVHVELDGDKITNPGVALTAVNSKNTRASDAESILQGQTPSDDLFAEAGAAAARASDPETDVRGSVEWKRNVVATFTKRALTAAVDQARGG